MALSQKFKQSFRDRISKGMPGSRNLIKNGNPYFQTHILKGGFASEILFQSGGLAFKISSRRRIHFFEIQFWKRGIPFEIRRCYNELDIVNVNTLVTQ